MSLSPCNNTTVCLCAESLLHIPWAIWLHKFLKNACTCCIVTCCKFVNFDTIFCQQLFGQLLSLYNETPEQLPLTLSKWLLLSLYSDLIQCETWSTLDSFNAGLVWCKNSSKLDLFDAGLIWHLTYQSMPNSFAQVKLHNVTCLFTTSSHSKQMTVTITIQWSYSLCDFINTGLIQCWNCTIIIQSWTCLMLDLYNTWSPNWCEPHLDEWNLTK